MWFADFEWLNKQSPNEQVFTECTYKSLDQNVAQRVYFKRSVKCWWCVITATFHMICEAGKMEIRSILKRVLTQWAVSCTAGRFGRRSHLSPKSQRRPGFFGTCWWFGTSLTLPLKHKAMRFWISSSMLCWDLGSVFCGGFMPFPIVLGRICTTWCKISCINKQLYYCTTFLSSGCFFLCNLTSLFFSLRIPQHRNTLESVGVSRRWILTRYKIAWLANVAWRIPFVQQRCKHNRCI